MKQIISIIKKIISKDPAKPLGRWNIDYCSKKTNQKIDLSNEDHCGPCGQYAITKITKPELETKITDIQLTNSKL
jgi:hypothetical protein